MPFTKIKRDMERLDTEANDSRTQIDQFCMNWIIEGKLAQSEFFGFTRLDDIKGKGIKAIVSLVRRIDEEIIRQKGFEYLEEYVVGLDSPTIDQFFTISKFVDSMIQKEKPVLVHCIGAGRSGTAIAGYLIYKGLSYESAVSEVKRKITGTIAIESPSQFQKLKEFALVIDDLKLS